MECTFGVAIIEIKVQSAQIIVVIQPAKNKKAPSSYPGTKGTGQQSAGPKYVNLI